MLVAWAVASSTVLVHPIAAGVLRGAIVASSVAVGCYLAHRRPESRFGLLLAGNGFLFGLTALTAASDAVVFTLGRLANLKHAGSTARATIRVREIDANLVFDVSDNGSGFRSSSAAESGGLRNMRDRAGAAGGTVEVTSAPGDGTLVHGVVPIVSPLAAS